MSNKSSPLFVLSSPSGGGKTTLLKRLLRDRPELKLSVSCTTRPKRPGESEGKDYYFLSREDFQKKIDNEELLEWEEVHGYYYGTPKDELIRADAGLLFDLDTSGAQRVKKIYPQAILIFIQPPSLTVLEQRLRNRGTEDPDELKRRMDRFRLEMAEKDNFDYIIINDDIDAAVRELKSIIDKEQTNI